MANTETDIMQDMILKKIEIYAMRFMIAWTVGIQR